MSTARAERFLLERLSSSQTVLVPLMLDGPLVGADGQVGEQSVVLVGAHQLRQLPQGDEAVAAVLTALAQGVVPEGVAAPVTYRPRVSAGMAQALTDPAITEILFDGPRASGKTQAAAGCLLALAELHARAGYPLPFLALWLHTSLVSATAKTVPSLLEPQWSGGWALREAGQVAVFTLGGVELVRATFVGTDDEAGGERARANCQAVLVEEVVASLHEGGVKERTYDLARSSTLRTPTARRVSILTTNPGSEEHWAYTRFIHPGRPGCARCQVPAHDRLTPEEDAGQVAEFQGQPDLQRRLGLGEWCGLQLGQQVVPNFNPSTHVAPQPLAIVPYAETWMAWDSSPGSHCHCTVIAQHVGFEVHILAALVSEHTGLAQHLEDTVLPWTARRMPWLRSETGRNALFHRYDPSMEPHEGGDRTFNGVRRVRDAFGGHFHNGKATNDWFAMINPLLELLDRTNHAGGMAWQFDPGPDTALARRAFAGEAYYRMAEGGTVAKDKQAKPNHPWEDLLDTCCYLAGGVAPQLGRDRAAEQAKYQTTRYAKSSLTPWKGEPRRATGPLSR